MKVQEIQAMAQGYECDSDLAYVLEGYESPEGYQVSVIFNDREYYDRVVIADVICDDGTQRVALYRDPGQTAIDCLKPDQTVKDFADGWYTNNGEDTPLILKKHLIAA